MSDLTDAIEWLKDRAYDVETDAEGPVSPPHEGVILCEIERLRARVEAPESDVQAERVQRAHERHIVYRPRMEKALSLLREAAELLESTAATGTKEWEDSAEALSLRIRAADWETVP